MKLYRLNWWTKAVRPDGSNDEYWDSMIHPEDLNIVETGVFAGNIFNFVSENDDYLHITNGINSIRINQSKKTDCLTPVTYEGFFIGDRVRVNSLEGINTERRGKVCYMFYHHKEGRIVYHIQDETGKEIKKRYRSDDLLKTY